MRIQPGSTRYTKAAHARSNPAMNSVAAAVHPQADADAVSPGKIRIAQIGGRFLVFDVADVARLRRQYSMCGVLVGVTPQAPNQNVFNGLPLELAPDEVRWLVHDRQAAYVADDWVAHLAGLADPAARRRYLDGVLRQQRVAQAAADEVAAERRKHSAEMRAKMVASNVASNAPKKNKKKKNGNKAAAAEAGKTGPLVDDKRPHADAAALVREEKTTEATEHQTLPQESDVLLLAVRTQKKMEEAQTSDGKEEEKKNKSGQREAVGSSSPTKDVISSGQPLLQVTPTTSTGLVGDAGEPILADGSKQPGDALGLVPLCRSALAASSDSSAALRAHLADHGYYATPGLRFGGSLSVYPGDPFRYHAHFVATSYDWDEPIPLLDLVSTGRLASGVKKGLLIGSARPRSSDGSDDDSSDGGTECKEDGPSGNRHGRGNDVRTFTLEWAAI
ncbi:Endonuclease TnsA [Niveomyces insectorum RCEF 264]|uniref:tRNA-intron lyase n=1 Tax=Niveomyces insectorum RCEF 264 TaxID=1081102 RepID=A0A168A7K1_9HYPO|nr:Endonuclease TnsA [Niveomyces insectorum RCEF 264]